MFFKDCDVLYITLFEKWKHHQNPLLKLWTRLGKSEYQISILFRGVGNVEAKIRKLCWLINFRAEKANRERLRTKRLRSMIKESRRIVD